eukprot:TRINITY_DN115_c1_g1_i1.p1 TRINITY_DN115_c1_g1~~TRINITY_DN115_c1_g1_i1.p1  ORF type:complete len:157 (-),score=71.24 TRINITY_DN115_c1_g1_i1:145-615(-)
MNFLLKNKRFITFYKNLSGYRKYGLFSQDLVFSEHINEALKRVSPEARESREKRLRRAFFLSVRKEILPHEQWTNYNKETFEILNAIEEIENEENQKKLFFSDSKSVQLPNSFFEIEKKRIKEEAQRKKEQEIIQRMEEQQEEQQEEEEQQKKQQS